MKLAFARHYSELIVRADGEVARDEADFLASVFPRELMEQFGLHTDEEVRRSHEEACKQLPVLLGHHEKLGLVGLFFSASHSDGQVSAVEMKVLKEAATILGLEGHEVVDYLARIW